MAAEEVLGAAFCADNTRHYAYDVAGSCEGLPITCWRRGKRFGEEGAHDTG